MSCRAARSYRAPHTVAVTCRTCGVPLPDRMPGLTAPLLCPACRAQDRIAEFRSDRMRPSVITIPVLTILHLFIWWIVLRGGITSGLGLLGGPRCG
jgi:hypothetical protein